MKPLMHTFLITMLWAVSFNAFAVNELDFMQTGVAYKEARAKLIEKGWQPIKNKDISQSSLYAQDIYDEGMSEVVDCISMELDACVFRFTKQKQLLEIKTITRQLKLDTFKIKKR